MQNFWESSVWGFFNVFAMLLSSILLANTLKRKIKFLRESLIPTSVLAGTVLLIIATVYKAITGDVMFDTDFFGGNGMAYLEMITYHTLALGFIAATLKTTKSHLNKERTRDILNTGVTTVATYVLQGSFGMAVTIIAALVVKDLFSASGILLAFGFGQGTGQAMNYGMIYEALTDETGASLFPGGKSFGLTIAACGFLFASFGGVIHLNILKRKGKLIKKTDELEKIDMNEVQSPNDIPMQESVDKLSIQIALMALSYFIAYIFMYVIGSIFEGARSIIYGFNFIIGVLAATLVKFSINWLKKHNFMHHEYANNFLLTRVSNFFFDIMVVAGIAAIRLDLLDDYWGIIAIIAIGGMIITYAYNRIVAKTLFEKYPEEQFMAMYGMLTGTASTGIILLREIDGEFKTPVADNLVYQNFPAMLLGFPLMLLATLAPKKPILTALILFGMFIVLTVFLFRSKIFRKKRSTGVGKESNDTASAE